MNDIVHKTDPKRNRDQDGKVKTQNRNITTNPRSKILGKFPPFMKDEYHRAHEKYLEDLKKDH